jgi:hypothetical protein
VLAIPDGTVHRTKLADWLELNALSSPDGRIGFGTLVSAVSLSADEQSEDIAEEDTKDEQLVLSVQGEISRRCKSIGEDYPFQIDDKGRHLSTKAGLSDAGAVYLFCLFLSHAHDRTVIPKRLAPRVTNRVRDLFQASATVAAGGFVQGPAVSFGWPRPGRTGFLKALHEVYTRFGDGKPVRRPRPAASAQVKDDGIDLIAWRLPVDSLPGTQYLLAQVASGEDWVHKSVVTDSRHFHKYWFEHQPACQHQDAMFMPFCLEPPEIVQTGVSYDEVLTDHMQSLSYRHGNVFYRYKIAKYFAEGLRIHKEVHAIERTGDLPKIVRWVRRYLERLRSR